MKTYLLNPGELTSAFTIKKFPFKGTLTLAPLVEYWESVSSDKDSVFAEYSQAIIADIRKHPELKSPITDDSLLKKNERLIQALMTPIIPVMQGSKLLAATSKPFETGFFFATDAFKKINFTNLEHNENYLKINEKMLKFGKTITAYCTVLNKIYNADINFEYPIIFKSKEPETGLLKYYNITIDHRFLNIRCTNKKKLTDIQIKKIVENILNLDYIMSVLPPEDYFFEGFVIVTAMDATYQQILSQLKFNLLLDDVTLFTERFNEFEGKLRTILKVPSLKAGIVAFHDGSKQSWQQCRSLGSSFLLKTGIKFSAEEIENSVYGHLLQKHSELVIIDNLNQIETSTKIEELLLLSGIKNLILIPLLYKNVVIGILELGSEFENKMNILSIARLHEIIPLLTTAVKRIEEEYNYTIQSVIKDKCTAIHSSVEWRFREVAKNYIDNHTLDEIVFRDVYPLYGISDIRSSSAIRNQAILEDLSEHLSLVKDIIVSAKKEMNLPVLEEIEYRIDKQIEAMACGLNSGHEYQIINFLQTEIAPLFRQLIKKSTKYKEKIETLKNLQTAEHQYLFSKRKDFEESFTLLTEAISRYIDREEIKAQKSFPHYFEKYKTDGIEHNIYVGNSLFQNICFDEFYLRNLRLWQLMLFCGVVTHIDSIKEHMKIPLEVTHLILVHSAPLSIRFRYDEKKFDVDGAYNLRYEIIKKRIDKAKIKGSAERLTQPGKISIVYSQPKEAEEYLRFIEYLQNNGHLENEVEHLELETLQEVQGLQALRVTVKI
jgi:hypothetical protein